MSADMFRLIVPDLRGTTHPGTAKAITIVSRIVHSLRSILCHVYRLGLIDRLAPGLYDRL